MYPTVVVLLVESQRSMTDVCEISPSNASQFAGRLGSEARHATLGHLSFAVGPVESLMDSEPESQRFLLSQSRGGQGRDQEDQEDILESQVGTDGRLIRLRPESQRLLGSQSQGVQEHDHEDILEVQ